jgi:Ni,Fe-hydrogenase III small subunit
MLKAIIRNLRTGVVTTRYPAEPAEPPARFRGAPRVRAGSLADALPPASRCPSGAIRDAKGESVFAIDMGRCVFCGLCANPTPEGGQSAIEIGRRFELAARNRQHLVLEVGRGGDGRVTPRAADVAGEAVPAVIRRTLGRSLQLRHLDSGSCNACDWELAALLNPVYDVRRLGIDFVASPRHADGVIVTGPVTRNLETAVRRTYEAVPEPKIVIAVGACAVSGGIVGRSYASAGGVAEVLPVDVFIPGCPPRPEAIIFGILLAIGRLQARSPASP